MTDGNCKPISVSRRVQAPASKVFEILANPARHPGIDGSGMLQDGAPNSAISGVGEVFTMKMHNAEMGDYEMANHIVDYELDRRIAWEPVLSAASRPEDVADIGDRAGHRWSYELTADGPNATVVTETFDCSQAPDWLRKVLDNGSRWTESMTATLEKLETQCTNQ
jgi:uncharacterized protein YndB with AHSA1/START domain